MDLITRINRTAFLGREFLTWLWYRSDLQEGLFQLGERHIEVWFDQRLTLEALGDIKEQNVVKSESPTDTDEARASLLTGKQVKEARLRFIAEQKQWTATVKADDLSLTGLKIPALLSRDDDDKLYERFFLMEEVEDLLDALFEMFLAIRLEDTTWTEEVTEIRDWVTAT